MVSGLGAHASSVLIVTISEHINDNRGTSMELIGTLEACAPRPKPFSSGDANMHLRFEGAALASNGSTGLFVYKGVGNCHASHMRIMGELHEKIRYRIYEIENFSLFFSA